LKEFGEETEKREEELKNEFFKVQRPENVPLRKWVSIFFTSSEEYFLVVAL